MVANCFLNFVISSTFLCYGRRKRHDESNTQSHLRLLFEVVHVMSTYYIPLVKMSTIAKSKVNGIFKEGGNEKARTNNNTLTSSAIICSYRNSLFFLVLSIRGGFIKGLRDLLCFLVQEYPLLLIKWSAIYFFTRWASKGVVSCDFVICFCFCRTLNFHRLNSFCSSQNLQDM